MGGPAPDIEFRDVTIYIHVHLSLYSDIVRGLGPTLPTRWDGRDRSGSPVPIFSIEDMTKIKRKNTPAIIPASTLNREEEK